MYKKVIVLEIKKEYVLVMEEGGTVLRIRRKGPMHVGDQIYVLPEDLYTVKADKHILFTGRVDQEERRNPHGLGWPRRLAAIAAMLALMITVMLPKLTVDACAAVISFDAQQGVQMQLDANNKVLQATSVDGSISNADLKSLKGKDLEDIAAHLQSLLGSGPIIMAYAPVAETSPSPELEQTLRQLFSTQSAVFLTGDGDDISHAEEESVSLGRYLMGLRLTEEQLEALDDLYDSDVFPDSQEDIEDSDAVDEDLDDLDFSSLMELAQSEKSWLSKPEFQEALLEKLEDSAEDIKEKEEQKIEMDDDTEQEEPSDAEELDENDDSESDDD